MANTKRALLTSVLAIVACVAMLIGSTFAWFTDTASTGVNKIQAGNLDVELAYKNAKTEGNFKEAKADTKVFDENALWEPGYVEYVVLKISNAGNLALKYQLGINIADEKGSTNVYGDTFKLSDYIRFAVIDGDKTEGDINRDALVKAAGEGKALNEGYTAEDHLDKKGDEKIVTLAVWMPTTVGNEANHKADAAAPTIDLGIKVYATQYTYESDSFNDQYDAKATYYPVLDQAGLKDALAAGGEVKLDKDVATDALLIAKKSATLDLGGKTIANTVDIWNESTMAWSLISARGKDTTLTITGKGTLKAKENDNFAIDVQDGATVIVKDGTFIGNIHAVYVYEGTAIIEGGFFSVQQKYPDAAKANEFVLNCYDANRADGKAKITVTGGTFVNFNPADCQAEGAGTNFVADGYSVVAEKHGDDTWYKVVKTPEGQLTTTEKLNGELELGNIEKDENGKKKQVAVLMGDNEAADIAYSEHSSGYTGKGVLLGSTKLNKYGNAPAGVGEYSFLFSNGTINSAATGYASIDGYKNTSVYMLLPANSNVTFENMTFNGVVSFDIQKYTSPWSNLNSLTFKNCTFNGIIIGTCPASNVTFDGCTFNSYTNTTSANNSNPIWWREDTEGNGANANPIKTFTFVNNKVTGTRPVKIERIGKTVSPVFTIKNNTFDISKQAGDKETKNMAINIGMGENPNLPFTLIDDGNTISANTAALYTASLTGGSNWYKETSGMKVLDGKGNAKVITAMVWKTTTGATFELKSVD